MKNPGAGPGFEVAIPAQRGLDYDAAMNWRSTLTSSPAK